MGIDIEKEYTELKEYLVRIDDKYVKPHRRQDEDIIPNEDYKLDLKSYCTLVHAAYEEFIENICKYLAEEMLENINRHGRISWCTVCFLTYFVEKQNITDNDINGFNSSGCNLTYKKIQTKINEYYKKYIDVVDNNHGINVKYLQKLLPPVGLDIPDNIVSDSLTQLANWRGTFAHHHSIRIPKVPSFKDVERNIERVNSIVKILYDKARLMYYYKYDFSCVK